jgi:hypothetical protein
MKMRVMFCLIALAALLGGCKDDSSSPPQPKTETATAAPAVQPVAATQPAAAAPDAAKLGIANPASVNCGKVGGKTVIRKDAAGGGERGFCVFPDGSECEEWALFRGSCKKGESKKPATTSAPKRDPFTKP